MAELFKRDGRSGLYVPAKIARRIGMGCPKCDIAYFQPISTLGKPNEGNQIFIRNHFMCGQLDALEEVDGQVRITGPVDLRVSN